MPAKLQSKLNALVADSGYAQSGYLLDTLLRRRQGIEQLQTIIQHPGYEALLLQSQQRQPGNQTSQSLMDSTFALMKSSNSSKPE